MKSKDTTILSKNIFIQKVFANPIFIIISNWLFQGMRYMEMGERYLKIICTLISSLVIIFVILIIKDRIDTHEVIISFIVGHSLNWIFNGHLFVLLRYLPFKGKMTIEKMKSFICDIESRSTRDDFLQAVLIFGSISRGVINRNSDLDIRIIRKKGIWKAFRSYILAIKLRFIALIKRFPLDIYAFGDICYLRRLRDDEHPVIIVDNGFVNKYYKRYSNYKDALNQLKYNNGQGN